MPAPLSSGIRRALLNARPAGDEYSPPLDELSDLSTLYGANSVYRRLISSYNGALIRVRRDSDNAELDIGQDANGFLDTAAIIAFGAGTTVDMTTCYDQSGNNRPIAQSGGIQQPTIFSGGLLRKTSKGWPAPYCNVGASEYLFYSDPSPVEDTPWTYHYVFEPATRPGAGGFLLDGGGPGQFLYASITSVASPSTSYNYYCGLIGPHTHGTAMADNNTHVITAVFSPSASPQMSVKHDNDAAYETWFFAAGGGSTTPGGYTFYSSVNATFGSSGYWQEFILFDSEMSVTDRDLLHNNSRSFYGI